MTATVNAGYYLFPPTTGAKEWIEARPDYDMAFTHLLCLLYCRVGLKREELEMQGYRQTGISDVSWEPTEIYSSRTPMYSADLKRLANSSMPFDGVGDVEVSTFYGWTLKMTISYE